MTLCIAPPPRFVHTDQCQLRCIGFIKGWGLFCATFEVSVHIPTTLVQGWTIAQSDDTSVFNPTAICDGLLGVRWAFGSIYSGHTLEFFLCPYKLAIEWCSLT